MAVSTLYWFSHGSKPVQKENHVERFFTHPKTLSSKREGPLGLYIHEFAEQVSQQSYSRDYGRRRLQLVAELSRYWLKQQDLSVAEFKGLSQIQSPVTTHPIRRKR
jgi:hypothetical protein